MGRHRVELVHWSRWTEVQDAGDKVTQEPQLLALTPGWRWGGFGDDGGGDKPGTKLLTKMPSKTQNSCAHPSRGGLWWRGSISVTGVPLASSTARRVGLPHHGGLYVSGTQQVGVGLSQAGPFSQVKSESPPGLGVLVLSSVIPTLLMSRFSKF